MLLAPTPDTYYDLLARCSFDDGGRAVAMALVVIRFQPRPAPQSRQISTWRDKGGRIKNAPFVFICLLSLSTRSHHGRFLGRLGPAVCRGPEAAHVSGQVQRNATTQPLTSQGREKGPGDIFLYSELKLTGGN